MNLSINVNQTQPISVMLCVQETVMHRIENWAVVNQKVRKKLWYMLNFTITVCSHLNPLFNSYMHEIEGRWQQVLRLRRELQCSEIALLLKCSKGILRGLLPEIEVALVTRTMRRVSGWFHSTAVVAVKGDSTWSQCPQWVDRGCQGITDMLEQVRHKMLE